MSKKLTQEETDYLRSLVAEKRDIYTAKVEDTLSNTCGNTLDDDHNLYIVEITSSIHKKLS